MPPLPVIDNVFRVTLNWKAGDGIQPRNVIHVFADGATEAEIATNLDASADSRQWTAIPGIYEILTYSILKLDGTSTTVEIAADSENLLGGGSGDPVPEASQVVSLRTSQRGPRGRGRVFLGPCGEGNIESGFIVGDALADTPAGWTAFVMAMGAADSPVVVASYAHADAHQVMALSASPHVGTQRRRLLQTR